MAYFTLNQASLTHNYRFLQKLFNKKEMSWAPVLKLLCGNEKYIDFVLSLGKEQVCDARIANLKTIKRLKPEVETIYIKPPAKRSIKNIVKYADVSFNTEFTTIKWLSEEAGKQNKVHRVIIMIELGDLREGIMGDHLMDFYEKIFELPNIKVVGIGTNLNCLSGVMPSKDKLIQLCLYEQLIEARFNQKIEGVSGGSSVMVPLLLKGIVPQGINHFRVGETLFFGTDLFENNTIEGMKDDVFTLHSEVIEITEKPSVPYGELDKNPSGEMFEVDENKFTEIQKRAILDIGLLDISKVDFLKPQDPSLNFVGASSDMLVIDITKAKRTYKIGDIISFRTDYMGALRVMNSEYIEKRLI
ncbi:MAG: alanine/ornithine racemase family PLP-dependent enzyme [Algicola sp.]|nr:alanine/ornithine racemase family PLP-dependent enzyme [Algicola sp.]